MGTVLSDGTGAGYYGQGRYLRYAEQGKGRASPDRRGQRILVAFRTTRGTNSVDEQRQGVAGRASTRKALGIGALHLSLFGLPACGALGPSLGPSEPASGAPSQARKGQKKAPQKGQRTGPSCASRSARRHRRFY